MWGKSQQRGEIKKRGDKGKAKILQEYGIKGAQKGIDLEKEKGDFFLCNQEGGEDNCITCKCGARGEGGTQLIF